MITIRKATPGDLPRVMPLVLAFYKETLHRFGLGFHLPSVENTIKFFAEYHVGLLAEQDGYVIGVIAGAVAPSFLDYRQKIFVESIWYILPEFRGGITGYKLLKLVEEYCRKIGIDKIDMIGMRDEKIERLGKFYAKVGYMELETHYIKDLTNAKA